MSRPPTILVVDDDNDVREMMVEYLGGVGFQVLEADSAAGLHRMLAAHPVDLVLLDRTMPDGDALRLVPELKCRLPDVGIIVVTALAQEEECARGLDTGADDYVTKPFGWRELTARMRAVLRRVHRAAHAGPRQPQGGGIGAGAVRRTSRRRVSAILFADVEGYTRMMRADETATLRQLWGCMDGVVAPAVAVHGGRIAKSLGDGFIAEFPCAAQAMACALGIQQQVKARNARRESDRRLRFRIGLHRAEVVVTSDGDIFGDGVNLAARLQSEAAAGGIIVSQAMRDAGDAGPDVRFVDLGERCVKNIGEPVRMFALERQEPARSRFSGAKRGRIGSASPPLGSSGQAPGSLEISPFTGDSVLASVTGLPERRTRRCAAVSPCIRYA